MMTISSYLTMTAFNHLNIEFKFVIIELIITITSSFFKLLIIQIK